MFARPFRLRISGTPPRLAVALAVLVAGSVVVAAGTASRGSTMDLPKACTLLTQQEAEKLATIPLQPPVQVGDDFCEWDSPPEGGVAQVEVEVTTEVPSALDIDSNKVSPLSGLGDEAYEEEGYIFARKGVVWIEVHLLILDDWAPYVQPLRDTAAIVLSRIPAGAGGLPRARLPADRGRAPGGWRQEPPMAGEPGTLRRQPRPVEGRRLTSRTWSGSGAARTRSAEGARTA